MDMERLKEKARILMSNGIRSFVKDKYDNYFFCVIKEVWSDWLIVENFSGKREGEKTRILWIDVEDVQEYKREGDLQ